MPLSLMRNSRALDAISDAFTRADTGAGTAGSTVLGRTTVGNLPWKIISGSWQVLAGRVVSGTSGLLNPIIVIESGATDAQVEASVGAGGDAVYGRVTDAFNWLRLRSRRYVVQVASTITHPAVTTTYYWWTVQYSSENPYNTGYHSHLDQIDRTNGTTCPFPDRIDHVHDGIPTHGHFKTSCGVTSTYTRTTPSYTETVYTDETRYDAVLEKSVKGTVSSVGAASMGTAAISVLGLRMIGPSVWLSVNGGAFLGPSSVNEHIAAVQHGVGRGASEVYVHGIDNFVLTPLG